MPAPRQSRSPPAAGASAPATVLSATASRPELARGIAICRSCHDGIHDRHDEMHLARRLNSPAALLADPALRRHFAWVARQRRAVAGD